MTDRRFGFYLRPSLAMSRAQAEIHDLLARQYNLRAAGRLMPHATLKGFFKSDAPVAEMVTRLDGSLAGIPSFPIRNHGVVPYGNLAIVLDLHGLPEGPGNPDLIRLNEATWAALEPLIRPDCDFSPRDGRGPTFRAHLTLAMADIPAPFFDEILTFVREAEPIGPPTFLAEVVHLYSFECDDWSGRWWDMLRWELLHSWRPPPAASST